MNFLVPIRPPSPPSCRPPRRCQFTRRERATPSAAPPASDWSPLKNPVFRAIWIASAVSYTGFEIRNYAAPLLMGDFQGPFHLSEGMKQYTFAASTLPIPLLVLFAGALADRVDRRKLLIVTHLWMMLAAGLLGVLTMCNLLSPYALGPARLSFRHWRGLCHDEPRIAGCAAGTGRAARA